MRDYNELIEGSTSGLSEDKSPWITPFCSDPISSFESCFMVDLDPISMCTRVISLDLTHNRRIDDLNGLDKTLNFQEKRVKTILAQTLLVLDLIDLTLCTSFISPW